MATRRQQADHAGAGAQPLPEANTTSSQAANGTKVSESTLAAFGKL
jgi:hypothetical protein